MALTVYLYHNHLASPVGFGRLSLPSRYRTSIHTIPEPGDKPSGDQLTQAKRGSLDSSSDNHDHTPNDDGAFTTEKVAEPDSSDCAEEASERVSADCYALDVGCMASAAPGRWICCVYLRKMLEE
jgi:hypothetical protein